MNTGQQLGHHFLPGSSQIKLACMQVLFSIEILRWLCLPSMFCCDRQQAACNLVSTEACSRYVTQARRKAKRLPFETETSWNAAITPCQCCLLCPMLPPPSTTPPDTNSLGSCTRHTGWTSMHYWHQSLCLCSAKLGVQTPWQEGTAVYDAVLCMMQSCVRSWSGSMGWWRSSTPV